MDRAHFCNTMKKLCNITKVRGNFKQCVTILRKVLTFSTGHCGDSFVHSNFVKVK